jgi:preprotein translocase subunit YajC
VGAAFFGGVAAHAAVADDPRDVARRPDGRVFGPGPAGPGQPGQGGALRGTIGTIDRVEGTDVYLKTPDGRTVKVSTSDSTRVRVSRDGALSDLEQGQTVAVQGGVNGDGTVTAETITQQPVRGQ